MGMVIAKSGPQRMVMGACSSEGPNLGMEGEMDFAVGRSIINIANVPTQDPWNLRLPSGCSWGDIGGIIRGLLFGHGIIW